MHISVASGKGGTGKTLVSLMLSAANPNALLIDCDVEEPNLHLFLSPEQTHASKSITVPVPQFDASKCTRCGRCAERCLYNALAIVQTTGPMLFEELCHSCGGCLAACRDGAVSERAREVGTLTFEHVAFRPETHFVTGRQTIGVASGVPVIKALKNLASHGSVDVIADCPPGTACSTVAALRGSDYCLLVTEPTPFGLHDLRQALAIVKLLNLPAAVVLNKSEGPTADAAAEAFCAEHNLSIIARIPHGEQLAKTYAEGVLPDTLRFIGQGIWKELLGERWWLQ